MVIVLNPNPSPPPPLAKQTYAPLIQLYIKLMVPICNSDITNDTNTVKCIVQISKYTNGQSIHKRARSIEGQIYKQSIDRKQIQQRNSEYKKIRKKIPQKYQILYALQIFILYLIMYITTHWRLQRVIHSSFMLLDGAAIFRQTDEYRLEQLKI